MIKRVIADYRISFESVCELNKLGYSVIYTQPIDKLYSEVKGHTDMQIHFTHNKAIAAPEVYNYYLEKLSDINLICGSREVGGKYPYDIAYNACSIGGAVIANSKLTAKEILDEYDLIINTNQGYAKCSTCVVADNAVITADEGIYRSVREHDIEALKIQSGYISLYGMTGFIGGASGLLEDKLLAFNGDIKSHPDYNNIRDFCRGFGVYTVSLNKGSLFDIGSILRVK